MKIIRLAYYQGMNIFCESLGYDPEDLSWVGSGDFGNAYLTPDGKIIKETSSESEVRLAKDLEGKTGRFPKVHKVETISGSGYILQDFADDVGSQEIEDMFYMASEMIEQQGLDLTYVSALDSDEFPDDYKNPEFINFLDELNEIVRLYASIGVSAPDISPDNLGYIDGKLVAIDIDDRLKSYY